MTSFDVEAIKKLIRMGGAELAQELMERFLSEAPTRLAACLGADLKTVEQHCHRICSDSGWLGAREVQEAASQAEILAADGLGEALPEALEKLSQRVSPACVELLELLRQLQEGHPAFCDSE